MKKIQFSSMILLAALMLNSCKKVAPEAVTVQTNVKVTTIAGSGGGQNTGDYIDGIGTLSAFKFIRGITRDAAGNLYVTDQNNFRIRKITPEGVVSTFAGSGENGYIDGTGIAAAFSYLEGIAIDATGNLYVADFGNNAIRKITPAGVVSTYAGGGQEGYLDGPVANARFYAPMALAFDKAGNLYVGDSYNYVVRKITSAGIVSTFAGTPGQFDNSVHKYDGPADAYRFGFTISGITIDASGNAYVMDCFKNLLLKITPTGNLTTWAGDGTPGMFGSSVFADGLRVTAKFNNPFGITSDAAGNIYLADSQNHRIRKITPEGKVISLVGNGEPGSIDGNLVEARLQFPLAILSTADGSVIYFTENNRIVKIETVTTTTTPQNTWNNPHSWGNPK